MSRVILSYNTRPCNILVMTLTSPWQTPGQVMHHFSAIYILWHLQLHVRLFCRYFGPAGGLTEQNNRSQHQIVIIIIIIQIGVNHHKHFPQILCSTSTDFKLSFIQTTKWQLFARLEESSSEKGSYPIFVSKGKHLKWSQSGGTEAHCDGVTPFVRETWMKEATWLCKMFVSLWNGFCSFSTLEHYSRVKCMLQLSLDLLDVVHERTNAVCNTREYVLVEA